MSKFSVKKPMTVVVAVILVLILAVVSFTEMKTDLLPSINLPYAMIMTTYVGASPEEVENTLTRPIEQSMATISNIKGVSSISSENYSMVIMEFNSSVNMDTATIDIRESLDHLETQWDNEMIGAPIIMKMNPDMMPIMVAAVDAKNMDHIELSNFINDTLMAKLESVEGVASVTASGIVEEEVHVVLRQDKLDQVNETLQKSIKKELSKAKKEMKEKQQEIDSGLNEIDSGKAELENKKAEMNQGMSSASSQITDARMDMLKKELELKEGKDQLLRQETEAKSKLSELQAAEDELIAADNMLSEKEKVAEDAEKQLEEGKEKLTSAKEQLSSLRKQLEAGIAGIESNPLLDEAAKEAAKKELEKKMVELESGEARLKSGEAAFQEQEKAFLAGKEELSKARETLTKNKIELASGMKQLEDGLEAIATGLEQIKAGEEALASGKTTLTEKETELSTQKDTAKEGLTEAEVKLKETESQLQEGKKVLDEQLDNFSKTKEDALDAADIKNTLTVDMIKNILSAQNFSMPAGYVTEGEDQYLVRVGDKLQNVESVASLVLFDPGTDDMDPITLDEVADVFAVNNSDDLYAKVNGNDAVVFSFEKQNSYATAEVSDALKQRFDEISAEYPDVHAIYLMDQGIYIDLVVDSVLNNLIFGAILAVIVLIFFLKDIKPTFIVACSIPISVMFAIALMYFTGVTLNLISLSGLAVGVGMLVDNSIVVIENIYRLRQKGVSAVKASVTGAVQVAGAITASTLTTVCVFLPIVFVEGITKDLFTDMALTIAYSLGASLIVALTLIPMMSSKMLRNAKEKKHPFMDGLNHVYEGMIRWSLRFKPLVLLLAAVLLAGSAYLAIGNGTAFMPSMDSTQINVNLTMPKEAKTSEKTAYADVAMQRILTIDGIDSVGAMMGGGLMGSMGGGGASSDQISMYVLLKEDKEISSQEIAEKINELCADLPCEVNASGSNMDMSMLGGSGISLRIQGNEIPTLQRIASEVAELVSGIEGTTEVSNGVEDPAAEIQIAVDKEKAIAKGLTVAQVYAAIAGELGDAKASTTLQYENLNYPIIVTEEKEKKLTKEQLGNYEFVVTEKDGTESKVLLSEIAELKEGSGLSSIRRSANQRYLTVSASIIEGYNVGIVSTEVEKALDSYEMPEGYSIQSSGENDTINDSLFELVKMLLLAVAFIYLIMVAQFQSLLSPLIVMFTIPLAFTGGFLGLWITGSEISVISMIGFVMVAGIIVNNGIVLVDYINQLRMDGMEKKEAVVEAGKTRMRPILMTALTTVLGLSTMVLGVGMGADMIQPIAIVAVGGLLFGTITTLFVIPVIYDLLNRRDLKVVTEEELQLYEEL